MGLEVSDEMSFKAEVYAWTDTQMMEKLPWHKFAGLQPIELKIDYKLQLKDSKIVLTQLKDGSQEFFTIIKAFLLI